MNIVQKVLTKCRSISFRNHLVLGLVIRLGLIVYGEIQDEIAEVSYTDIDYKVVTDGARHVLQGSSPFKRHTYRYSPLLAILLLPNLLVHKCFGKVLFSLFDILTGILIERIVYNELKNAFPANTKKDDDKKDAEDPEHKDKGEVTKKPHVPVVYSNCPKEAALFWLYNPLPMVIATRGNGDSVTSFFVLATAYFIHKFNNQDRDAFFAGICLGVSIHLRIYPVIFSLPIFLTLANINPHLSDRFLVRLLLRAMCATRALILPNLRQKLLVLGTVLSLGILTVLFYYLYGMEYLQESYFYHFTRTDIRHNFSLYFLMQYLGMNIKLSFWGHLLKNFPRLFLLVYLSITFGWRRSTLSFCLFCQAYVLVTYNTVVTSQYFVWYLSLLPLCIKNVRQVTPSPGQSFAWWLSAQGLWLSIAYLLEFRGWNEFDMLGFTCGVVFVVNAGILDRLIWYFDVITDVKTL